MISTICRVWRSLRAARPLEPQPGWYREVLQSLRWMHQEHVKELSKLGYSPKEAFWLDFACLPFLPWNRSAQGRLRLGILLDLYADLYRSTVGPLEPADPEGFSALLRRRYYNIRQMVTVSDGASQEAAGTRPSGWTAAEKHKWGRAGLIVLWTAREWQRHPSAFPCRLLDD